MSSPSIPRLRATPKRGSTGSAIALIQPAPASARRTSAQNGLRRIGAFTETSGTTTRPFCQIIEHGIDINTRQQSGGHIINRPPARPGALLAIAVLVIAGDGAFAQNPVAEAQAYQREAAAAYRAGDFAAYTRSLETALALNPASLATRYNLACGYARSGQPDKAIELLQSLVDMQIDFGMAEDPDLDALRERPRFERMVADLAAATMPLINSTALYAVEELGLIPEGIAIDEDTDRLFFGSMRNGNVYVFDAPGRLSKFASVDREGRLSAIGMTVDRDRQLLWVVGTSFEMAENFDAERPTDSGVFGFDLSSGELQRQYRIDDADLGLNDVAIGPDGTLYASGEVLHVLDRDSDRLRPLETVPTLYGGNGITTDPDGTTLFVSAYPVGVAAIDLASRELRFLSAPAHTSLYGIDGLYWYEGDLIGIQNGVQPWRLLRMRLDDAVTAVVDVRVIELGNVAATPTTGAIVDDRIHYVGQGPAPDPPPGHFPERLRPFLGKTLIRTAPLDR